MDETTRPIMLTGLEVVFLVDAISNTDLINAAGNSDLADSKVPSARNALIALASSYVEVVDLTSATPGILPGPVTISVTEEQTWVFRSAVRTSTLAIDKSPIGPALSCKLLELLLLFRYEPIDLDTGPNGPVYDDLAKQQLEEYHARVNADPYEDYGPHNGAQPVQGRPGETLPSPEGKGDSDNSAVSAGLADYQE